MLDYFLDRLKMDISVIAECLLKGYLSRENKESEIINNGFGPFTFKYKKNGKDYSVLVSISPDPYWEDEKTGNFCILPKEARLMASEEDCWICKCNKNASKIAYISNKKLKTCPAEAKKGQKFRYSLYLVDCKHFTIIDMI